MSSGRHYFSALLAGALATGFSDSCVVRDHRIPDLFLNQSRIARLLRGARPVLTREGNPRVGAVILNDGTKLVPDATLTLSGYRLVLHRAPRPRGFEITAQPAEPFKTGIYTFFLDESGVLKYEKGPDHPANTHSRLLE
jgi:hypothetical protein